MLVPFSGLRLVNRGSPFNAVNRDYSTLLLKDLLKGSPKGWPMVNHVLLHDLLVPERVCVCLQTWPTGINYTTR